MSDDDDDDGAPVGKYEREGADQFSEYTEERTARGWRIVRRRLNGYEFRIYAPTTEDYIKAFLASGVDFRLNTMSDRLEVMVGEREPRPLSDIDESVLFARLLDYGMRNESHMRKALHTRAAENRYHPIRQYLDGLTWDGRGHFDALMHHLEMSTENAAGFWRKFLLGSLARCWTVGRTLCSSSRGRRGRGSRAWCAGCVPCPFCSMRGQSARTIRTI
jgi:hypothetical protein